MIKVLLKVFSFVLLLLFVLPVNSQELLNNKNLSLVKIDQLSDADIVNYQKQLKSSGISEKEAEQLALSRGLPPAEVTKLRLRLSTITSSTQGGGGNTAGNNQPRSNNQVQQQEQTAATNPFLIDPKIFGSELFGSSSLSFQPDLKIATPVNYVLGPDDALNISVYGLQEAAFNLTVSPEGSINIPNVGEVLVSGLTVEAATSRIRSRMASIYTSLRSGHSKLAINLGKIRSIRVTIIGAAKSGTYTVSSLSTLFNALFLAGGPAQNRSFRKIELLRNNKVDRVIDLYQYLLTANQSDNVRLQDNDVIRLPIYDIRVEIAGEVKRPGIYEMLPTENASDLVRFASGFTDSAYRASVKVYQFTETDRRIKDFSFSEFVNYKPQSGDVFEVSKILNTFQNRVAIQGAVLRPGNFELTTGLSVGELIKRAFLRTDAFTNRGQILRSRPDSTREVISFDVSAAVRGETPIVLQREDVVSIFSFIELRNEFGVRIQGEVRNPGAFKFVENLTLKDLILQAGGFTDAAYPQRIEVARLIKRDTLTEEDKRLSEIIDVRNLSDLSLTANNLQLRPSDVVTVRRLPGYLQLESVQATGQVQFPGPYVLATRSERVADLLRRAGGLTPEAFRDGAYLVRQNKRDISTEIATAKVEKIQQQLRDSTGDVTGAVNRTVDQIPLDLAKILASPNSEENLVLKAGDQLFIPRNDEEIRITGEVLFPTQAPYNRAKSLKDYISDAGGFTDNARKKRAYVLYPNGKAASTSRFLFFRNYPEVKPGSEIIVPKYIPVEKPRRSAAETIALTSALASLAYIVFAIINL